MPKFYAAQVKPLDKVISNCEKKNEANSELLLVIFVLRARVFLRNLLIEDEEDELFNSLF